jgi:WD40 repeat protein
MPGTAHGQVLFVSNTANNTIGAYDANTGAEINASFITGLSGPKGLAVSGSTLFVANSSFPGSGTIGKYDASTGAVIDASFITGAFARDLAVSGSNLFVTNGSGAVAKYDAITGATINLGFVTVAFGQPQGVAVSGSSLFVGNASFGGTVGKYDVATGTTTNSSFVTGLVNPHGVTVAGSNLFVSIDSQVGKYDVSFGVGSTIIGGLSSPVGLAVSGLDLFVANSGNGTIGKYDATNGAALNTSFITGLSSPAYIAFGSVAVVPEPSSYAVLVGVGALGVALLRRGRRAQSKRT